jgi:ABC-type branched-subunit amino acid transport system ATPase component
LLLDEPTAGMNPHETAGIVTLIQAIRAMGITVFLIEHDMKVIMNASDGSSCSTTARRSPRADLMRSVSTKDVIQAYMGRRGARA